MFEITSRLSTALTDRYQIERHLGEGGMATVYLAHDLRPRLLGTDLGTFLGTYTRRQTQPDGVRRKRSGAIPSGVESPALRAPASASLTSPKLAPRPILAP